MAEIHWPTDSDNDNVGLNEVKSTVTTVKNEGYIRYHRRPIQLDDTNHLG